MKKLSFWDWFFIPLWILSIPVGILGAQGVVGGNPVLLAVLLAYCGGSVPYLIAKGRKWQRPKRTTRSTSDHPARRHLAPEKDDLQLDGRSRLRTPFIARVFRSELSLEGAQFGLLILVVLVAIIAAIAINAE